MKTTEANEAAPKEAPRESQRITLNGGETLEEVEARMTRVSERMLRLAARCGR